MFFRIRVVTPEHEQLTQPAVGPTDQVPVVEDLRPFQGAAVVCFALFPLSDQLMHRTFTQQEFDDFLVFFALRIQVEDQLLVKFEGLAVLKIALGVAGGFFQVFIGIPGVFGFGKVKSQVHVAFLGIGVQLFDGLGNELMQLPQPRTQLHVVGGFPEQRMPEDVAQFVHRVPDLPLFSGLYLLPQHQIEVPVTQCKFFLPGHDRAQHGQFKLPADHRCGLDRLFDQSA